MTAWLGHGHDGRLTVWGAGYVGLSSALHFAARGHRVLVRDILPSRVAEISRGEVHLPGFEEWTGLELAPFVARGTLSSALADTPISDDDRVHLLALPTERDGRPWLDPIDEVFGRLSGTSAELCIIESTCPPGTADRLSRTTGLEIAVSPRRDWFLGAGRDIRSLPRVVAGTSPAAAERARDILATVSPQILLGTQTSAAELAKCLENSIHHVIAQYVTQIARAYPEHDVNEALELAASHWRIGTTYFAGVGTGGYCVPVATSFLITAAQVEGVVSIGEDALRFGDDQREFVANLLARDPGARIGILGLTYRGDVPSVAHSPFLDIARQLRKQGREILVHDPYLARDKLLDLADAGPLDYPEGLRDCTSLLVGPAHAMYRDLSPADVRSYFRPGSFVLDNEGVWAELEPAFSASQIRYRRIGDGYG